MQVPSPNVRLVSAQTNIMSDIPFTDSAIDSVLAPCLAPRIEELQQAEPSSSLNIINFNLQEMASRFRDQLKSSLAIGSSGGSRSASLGRELDPYIGSDRVIGLRSDNFDIFMNDLDIAMVMFYHKGEPQCDWSRKHFKKAAALTLRDGHQFAAIDCEYNSNFCVEEGVTGFPHYKIYSRGDDVGFSSDARKLLYQDMKTWVEGFPVPMQANVRQQHNN